MRRVLALLLVATSSIAAQSPSLSAPLPKDPAVIVGRLPNGVRYFIRRNAKPEKRAELRLVVNAGSILERDDQRGLAHFVEHMAFNGTKRFPKAAIVNYLERIGMRFGADLNASTSFDETIYQLTIPTDTARLVNTGLDILEDWAHAVSFDATEIAKERGVVIEEWRTGRSASARVQQRQFPVMLRGSKYALRIPIGAKESLDTFADSLLLRFYRDWYRPDLMSVVAVGDFDAKAIEVSIRERFGRIPVHAALPKRTYADVPSHTETLVSIESDKEYPRKSVSLLWLKPSERTRTVGDERRDLIAGFYDAMMNERFQEMTQKPDAPFAFAGSGRGEFVRTKNVYQLVAGVKESAFVPAAEALLAEAERVRRFGFTASELERTRTNYLRDLEQAYAERDKTESGDFAASYVNVALADVPMMSIAQDQSLARALVPGIGLTEINALAKSTFTETDRVVLVVAPEKPDIVLPDAAAMLAVFGRASATTLAAYVDSSSGAALIPVAPVPGRIVSEKTQRETGITDWTLSNGARVLLKPTDFKADEVLFQGTSPGGASLVDDSDLTDAIGANFLLNVSGLGAFTQIELQKKLTGKKAAVGSNIGSTSESVGGQASRQDIETLFQLTWLRFTQPRVDSSAYKAFVNQVSAAMANQRNNPASVFADTITLTLAQHSRRALLLGPELLSSVRLPNALKLYKERFANAGDFTFYLVGSFSIDSVRPLVERYLASLPSTGVKEVVKDRGVRPPTGTVTRTVHKGVEPKASTRLVFTGPCDYSFENREILSGLRELLDIRLREVLREDKSGTYGVSVSASCSNIPYTRSRLDIAFGSAPERVDELTASVFAVIDSIKAGAVSDSNMTKIREMIIRGHETALKQNESWLSAMADADEDDRDQRDFLRVPEIAKALTREKLRDAARYYFNTGRVARFTLLPESTPKAETRKPR
jgi:zinc protease